MSEHECFASGIDAAGSVWSLACACSHSKASPSFFEHFVSPKTRAELAARSSLVFVGYIRVAVLLNLRALLLSWYLAHQTRSLLRLNPKQQQQPTARRLDEEYLQNKSQSSDSKEQQQLNTFHNVRLQLSDWVWLVRRLYDRQCVRLLAIESIVQSSPL